MEDLLFERLDRMNSVVDPEVVLQDLYLMDRIVRPLTGPREEEYRVPYLLEALEAREFFSASEARWEAIEIYDDLCDLCDIHSYDGLAAVLARFKGYRSTRGVSPIQDR